MPRIAPDESTGRKAETTSGTRPVRSRTPRPARDTLEFATGVVLGLAAGYAFALAVRTGR